MMLLQVPRLQSVLVYVVKNGFQQVLDRRHEGLQLFIVRVLPKVFIQVSNQMHPTLLLPTWYGVIAWIEIGYENSFVLAE
jgi:hypothetical protein